MNPDTIAGHSGQLGGLTVVEIGHSIAAPYAGMILAELGAAVIKIEPPEGDPARGWGPPFHDGTASAFLGMNRGKRSVTVKLADDRQRQALRGLIIDRADIVICNLRPGLAVRYGLDGATLTAEQPGLIYADIGAFGSGGPLAGKPGYDPLIQAYCGIMSVTGEGGDRPPVRVGVSLVDMAAGMWAAIGVMAALRGRARTGRGGVVETSLFETGLAWMNLHVSGFIASGDIRRPYGSGLAEIVPYQAFRASDGWLMIAAGNDGLFRRLADALERPALVSDPRFATNAGRVRHREALLPIIADALSGASSAQWRQRLDAAGVPNAPLQTIDAVIADAQTGALGIVQPAPGEGLATVGLPLRFDGARPAYRCVAPALGEHTAELLPGGLAAPALRG